MESKKGGLSIYVVMILIIVGSSAANSAGADTGGGLSDKCASEFQKVMQCLPFVTSKANVPSKECCDSATELKNSDPTCLCYIIQQIHNGSNAAVKNMGVQESRLLQLPSACKMTNASVAECPKLLHLAPNSPDAAIFTNTSIPTTSTPPGVSSPTSSSSSGNSSNGVISYKKTPQFIGMCLVIVFMLLASVSV